MIIRQYIECDTCGQHYRLRIQLGLRDIQKHTFHCTQCKEPIALTLEIGKGTSTDVNCHFIPEDENAISYYLSPDFVASAEDIHDPKSFPALDFMQGLLMSFDGKPLPKMNKRMIEMARNSPVWRVHVLWPEIQKAWRLYDAKQYSLGNRILQKIATQEKVDGSRLPDVQFFFIHSIVQMDNSLIEEMNVIKNKNSNEFAKFLEYYQRTLRRSHAESVYSIISDYFESYLDFTQVALYMRNNGIMPANAHATSVNFDAVKGFYAKAYEFYAGAICIYTCLNNIKNGRPFDQLEKISLEKYLTTDKAERRKTLESNKVFHDSSKEFDSNIRNAAYHNWFKLTPNKQEIEYRSGGNGQLRNISYASYLFQCSTMLSQICRLYMLELLLDEYARGTALVSID